MSENTFFEFVEVENKDHLMRGSFAYFDLSKYTGELNGQFNKNQILFFGGINGAEWYDDSLYYDKSTNEIKFLKIPFDYGA